MHLDSAIHSFPVKTSGIDWLDDFESNDAISEVVKAGPTRPALLPADEDEDEGKLRSRQLWKILLNLPERPSRPIRLREAG